jgi:tetratricopeptide (TPR) repeat protein
MVAIRRMKAQPGGFSEIVRSSSIEKGFYKLRFSSKFRFNAARDLRSTVAAIAALVTVAIPMAVAQPASSHQSDGVTIRGAVLSQLGKPVGDALVRLEQKDVAGAVETKTDAVGGFAFSALRTGSYVVSAEKSGLHSRSAAVNALSRGDQRKVDLVLEDPGLTHSNSGVSSSSIQAMTFSDKPNFTVAGVTDWTAVGGHGSDTSLRTSEALASETLTLKPNDPGRDVAALGSNREANQHRLAGELDEKSDNPLGAVREFEQAVHLDPSEQNYFEWASELLLHRAVWQAQEVFQKGVEAHPKSARMLAGLGAALFAGARYDEAAQRLCDASDLNPTDPEPYIFIGKVQIAAPNPLVCVEKKLARFVHDQPGNSLANYFYAMAILKRHQQSADKQSVTEAYTLLTKAVTIDANCSDAYLQLGILAASERNFLKAIGYYQKAIDANPESGDAHYRLGVAYDRVGEPEKAKQEFRLHDEIEKRQAEETERQRREVKQFLIVLPEQAARPPVQ